MQKFITLATLMSTLLFAQSSTAQSAPPPTTEFAPTGTLRVAINGFGRIGRLVLRSIAEHARRDIEVVAINDLGPVETNAHLFRYDSVHGRFPGTVTSGEDWIDIGMGKIKVTAIRDPKDLPHKDLNVDIADMWFISGKFVVVNMVSHKITRRT